LPLSILALLPSPDGNGSVLIIGDCSTFDDLAAVLDRSGCGSSAFGDPRALSAVDYHWIQSQETAALTIRKGPQSSKAKIQDIQTAKMPSAVDIITYVGIPLAVLGVLPTLYTCLKSILTLRQIRRTLDENDISAITRSSLLSGIIEIELPRKSLAPLDRWDPAYFAINDKHSLLKGGSWTVMCWRELVIGNRGYRLQYHDELVQPQAQVDFEPLVAFLLDRGAVPSETGFADLRSSGLWTPAGTRLLLSPMTADAVLSVATSEDSDGILSLNLEWRPEWDKRSVDDLPPYWMRIRAPSNAEDKQKEYEKKELEAKQALEPAEPENTEKPATLTAQALKPSHARHPSKASMTLTIPDGKPGGSEDFNSDRVSMYSHYSTIPHHFASDIRLRLGPAGVEDVIYDDEPRRKFRARHLKSTHGFSETNASAMWFASAATALGAPLGGLWSFAVPDEIIALSRLDSVPCGVMVLLELVEEDSVPAWRTVFDDDMNRMEQHHAFLDRAKRMHEEHRLPHAERQKAMMKRVDEEFRQQQFEREKKRLEMERRKLSETVEALGSARLGVGPVAEANRKWMIKNGHAKEGDSIKDIVESLLWEMVRWQERAHEVARMLEAWKGWVDNGGMTKAQFELVKSSQLQFAYASCVLSLVKDTAGSTSGSVVSDLQECLRIWKRVRLG
jgi:hypothetical protein